MTEQRVSYTAWSSDQENTFTGRNTPPCEQRGGVLLPSFDSVLLLPVMQSVQSGEHDAPLPCLQLVRLHDARLGLCNIQAQHTCACCACPICAQHQSGQWISLPDAHGVWSEERTGPLCETCALMPREMMYTLHAFRMIMNQQQS